MTTVQDLIDRTRQHVMSGQPDRINILAGAIAADVLVTTFELTRELKGIAEGSRLSIGTEEFHVLALSGTTAGSTVTVIRAFDGTTLSAHAAGDIVRVNPQFSDYRILKSMQECIEGLTGDGLYQVKTVEFPYLPARMGYDLGSATGILDVYRVSYGVPGPTQNWPIFPRSYWEYDPAADTTQFPSGKSLILKAPAWPGQNIKVAYKTDFVAPTLTSTDMATVGLQPSAYDIPPMGAALRVNLGRDIKRTFLTRQPEPRRQEEVPPNSAQGAIQALTNWYYRAINREIAVLNRLYPMQSY